MVSRPTVVFVPYTLIMLADGITAHALDWSVLRYAGRTEIVVEAAAREAAVVASVVRSRLPVPVQAIVLHEVQPDQGVAVQLILDAVGASEALTNLEVCLEGCREYLC